MVENTNNTNLVSNEEISDVVNTAHNTGIYTDVKFKDDLIVSCIKTQENYIKCGLDISLDYGYGEGPVFHFDKKVVVGDDWKKVLNDTLYDCGRNFESKEIWDIANLATFAINNGKVEECGDKMTLRDIIRNLYDKALEFESGKKVNGVKNGLLEVTIYENCITINGKSKVTQEILNSIDSGWEHSELKKALKTKRLLNGNIDKYYNVIQTEEAKSLGVRKLIQIPLSKVKNWIELEEKEND